MEVTSLSCSIQRAFFRNICLILVTICFYFFHISMIFVDIFDQARVTFVLEKPLVERKRNPAGEQSWGREWWITQGLGGHTDCRTQIHRSDTQMFLFLYLYLGHTDCRTKIHRSDTQMFLFLYLYFRHTDCRTQIHRSDTRMFLYLYLYFGHTDCRTQIQRSGINVFGRCLPLQSNKIWPANKRKYKQWWFDGCDQ